MNVTMTCQRVTDRVGSMASAYWAEENKDTAFGIWGVLKKALDRYTTTNLMQLITCIVTLIQSRCKAADIDQGGDGGAGAVARAKASLQQDEESTADRAEDAEEEDSVWVRKTTPSGKVRVSIIIEFSITFNIAGVLLQHSNWRHSSRSLRRRRLRQQ